jgi:phosphohistidine phosphatase SixA
MALLVGSGAAADEAAWALLRGGGHTVLIRHAATVPGVGDPPGFRHDDCATQRLLSDAGRAQARRLGEAFRARGVRVGEVLTSRWCRCEETARLAFGRAQTWTALNSMHHDRSRAAEQEQALRARLARHGGSDTLVLVTHAANIAAWTGVSPRPGEVVVLAPGATAPLRAAGRLVVE